MWMQTKMILGILSFLVVVALFQGCRPQPKPIVFVFPDGFQGIFTIKAEEPDGVKVAPSNSISMFFVPADGLLKLAGESPVRAWNSSTARYADGKQIPIWKPAATISKDETALRFVGTVGKED